MTERRVSVRLAAVGGQTLKDDLRAVGREGRAALESIAGEAPAASRGLQVVGADAEAAVARLERLSARASQLAASLQQSATVAGRVDRITGVTGGVSRDAADIAAYGKALDGLRAQYNPLFAVIQRYKGALEDIRQAHRVGAISADEMSAAIGRERRAALDSIAAVKGRATSMNALGKESGFAAYQSRMLLFQLNDIGVSLAGGQKPLTVMVQQGAQIAQMYAGQGGVNAALKQTGSMLVGIVTKAPLVTAAIVATSAAVAGLTHAINESGDAQVTMGDTALAVFQTIGDGIWDKIKPAVDAIAPWFDTAFDAVADSVHWIGNLFINTWTVAFDALATLMSTLPNIVGAAVVAAANAVLTGIEMMVQKALDLLQSMLDGIGGMIAAIPGMEGFSFGSVGSAPPLPKIPNPFAADVSSAWSGFADRASATMQNDPLGDFYESVKKHAVQNAKDREEEEKKKGGGGATSKKQEADATAKLVEQLTQELAVLQESDPVKKRMLGYAKELTSATDEQKAAVLALVEAIQDENTGWGAVTRTLSDWADDAKRVGDDIGKVFTDVFDGMGNAVAEFVKTGKLDFASLVTDMIAQLAKLAVQKAILGPVADALSGALGGLGGGDALGAAVTSWFHHAGGRVGEGSRFALSAANIAGAPRFHSGGGFGLRSDEQVAVLQTGERVLNRRQTREWDQGGGTVVNINARDAQSFRRSRAQVAADISRAVAFGRRSL